MTVLPQVVVEALARLGLEAGEAREVFVGYTNTVYQAGRYAVRVSREAEFEDLHGVEAEVIPHARRAGVATPELVAIDDSRAVIPMVFSVYPWVEGQTLGRQGRPPSQWREAAKEMGRQAARLHKLDGIPEIEPAWWPSPEEAIDTLTARETFTPTEGAAIHVWFRRLESAAPDDVPVLVHNDLHAWNLLVADGKLTAILDWADAGLGEPALDFAGLPLELLPAMMEGYREVRRTPPFFEAAVLKCWLGRALEEMVGPDEGYDRAWRRWPKGGLAEVWLILHGSGPEWSVWAPE